MQADEHSILQKDAGENRESSHDVQNALTDMERQALRQYLDWRVELDDASSYGGGYDEVLDRPTRPKANSTRPASVSARVWKEMTSKQKADEEAKKPDNLCWTKVQRGREGGRRFERVYMDDRTSATESVHRQVVGVEAWRRTSKEFGLKENEGKIQVAA